MNTRFPKVVAVLLCVCMLLGLIPVTALAAVDYTPHDTYYKVISKDDYELAPGITESEIVLNNDEGSRRQVAHVVQVDINNPYTKVMPSAMGMKEGLDAKNYGVQIMSEQAAYAEANGYGNVVAAMNLSLSWYNSDYYVNHPELVGEPLGYLVMDGELYVNSQGQTSGARTCLVINFDEKDGVARPSDMPKTEIRAIESAITGWEEQVIPANFGFLVKDGVNQYSKSHTDNGSASRSFVGIKADGSIVMVMNDGRQAPYSAGFTNYEMAEFMLSLGCVQAANGDGGGSSAFLSQRPGEELELHCAPSDGAERPTTHGILVISTAPATGEFVRAQITAENKFYTPGSSVQFSAFGTDLVGTAAEIPADATWQLADSSLGTIDSNGLFTSNGTPGEAVAQMVYNGKVVGECAVEVVIPEAFTFQQSTMTVPFGKEVSIALVATVNGGLNEVVLNPSDVTFSLDNAALGTIDGFTFTSVDEANAPATLTGTLTAKLNCAEDLVATTALTLGKGSEVIYDFEDSIDGWNVGEVNKHDQHGEGQSYICTIDRITAENGQVHNGNGAMHLYMDGTHSVGNPSDGVTQVGLYVDESVIIEGAKSLGFWMYIPDDFYHAMIRLHYWYDSNKDGIYNNKATVVLMNSGDIYNNADTDGWYYFSVDVSKYESIMIKGKDQAPANTALSDAANYRFIEVMAPHLGSSTLWRENGTINGVRDIYVDNITADFSEAVEDREAPIFGSVVLSDEHEVETAITKRNPVTTTSNVITVFANVAENTAKTNATGLNIASAKAYVDGVEVETKFANGRIFINNVAVADGMHRVTFEISDYAGNKATVIRLVNVQSGVEASTVQVVPQDATLDRLYGGSVYWMDVNATDIETIQSVTTTIDLNTGNHWELDHIVLAEGFTATYSVDDATNSATITITRTGENTQTGAATLASLPIRVISYENDLYIEGYDAVTYWNEYMFWPHDVKVDVDMGVITYVDGYVSDVLNAFSNEEFAVDTEMYTGSLYMDADFKAERGTCHVHTAVAIADKAATCTEDGYTGRTFCEVCNSVVEWGTTVPATGHNYEDVNGVLTCSGCGQLFNGELDGKIYIDGVIATGWVDNTYYYADGVMLTGSHLIDGVMYTFDSNGVYQPNYMYDGWYETDGTVMYFVANNYLTGPQKLGTEYYNFDANGKAFHGEVVLDGTVCVFDKGVSVETDAVLLAGLCGENAQFVIYQDGRMVITGSGDMVDYKSVGSLPWYANHRYDVKSLFIGKDITALGVRAFYNLYYLESVTFEEGSALKRVNGYTFGLNRVLKEIILPETVTYIGEPAFRNCKSLTKVYIPSGVTYIGPNAFYQTENVVLNVAEGSYAESYAAKKGIAYTTYDAPAREIASGVSGDTTWTYDSKGTLTISGNGAMADYATKGTPWEAYRTQIKKIVIGEGVTYIGKFNFYYCSSLTEVVFAENSALQTIGWGAFGYCRELTAITIPASVKTLKGYAFYFSTKLADVSFGEGSKLESIEQYAFKGDTGLENFFVPDGVTLIGPGAFLNCQETATFNVAEGSYAHSFFANNNIVVREAKPVVVATGTWGDTTWTYTNLGVLTISGNGVMADCNTFGAPWEAYRARIKKIVIGEGVTYIGKFNFYYSSSLTEIEFAANGALETIGWGAFGYCRALTTVTLPASLKTLSGYAMYYCTNLTDINFAEGSKLRTIGQYAFKKDVKLRNVFIPDGVTVIEPGAFEGSQSTATFYVAKDSYAHGVFANNHIVVREALPMVIDEGTCGDTTWTFDNRGVLTVSGNGAMADNAAKAAPWNAYRTQIKKVVIGEGVTYIGKFNFYYCNNLTEIEFAANGALKTIGWGAFGYCRALTTVTLPASVEVVANYAFYYCSKLTTFGVAEGSALQSIGQYAFKADGALTNVTLPAGTVIGVGAFEGTPIEA